MSNDNILHLPGSKGPTSEEVAALRRRDRDERKRRLSETLRQNQWLRGRADRISVAQALNDLLVRVEAEHGISPARVLGEVKPKKIAHKHKWDYAIPRKHRTSEEEETIDKRLKKGTKPYLNIIDAIVALASNLHKDDLLFEVFGQVEFRPGATQEPEDEYDELAVRLRFVANAISEKYKLSEFFRDVERTGVSPIPAPECVQRDAQNEILVGDEITIVFSPWMIQTISIGMVGRLIPFLGGRSNSIYSLGRATLRRPAICCPIPRLFSERGRLITRSRSLLLIPREGQRGGRPKDQRGGGQPSSCAFVSRRLGRIGSRTRCCE